MGRLDRNASLGTADCSPTGATLPRGSHPPSGDLSANAQRRLIENRVARRRAFDFDHAYLHFTQRALERIAPDYPVWTLWEALIIAIGDDNPSFVRFVCAAQEPGRQVWRFATADGVHRYCVWDFRHLIPITVLPTGGRVRRRGKNRTATLTP
jgi:hypothetical protein